MRPPSGQIGSNRPASSFRPSKGRGTPIQHHPIFRTLHGIGGVERHKGSIPLVAVGADRDTMTPAAKIMIVDDDVEIRQLLAEELHDLGHETVHAAEGVEALALVRCERPDLILLDLQLPELDSHGVGGGDGFSVLERLRSISDVAAIPVIVFSGTRSPEAEERALMLGAREFVLKSFSGSKLVDAIARALAGTSAPPVRSRSFDLVGA